MATVKKRAWTTKAGVSVAWVVRYYDADGQRRSEQFDTRTEANGRKVDIETELRAGIHTALSESPTVREIGEHWYAACEKEKLEDSTLRNYRGKLDRHIYPHIGAKKMGMLSAPDIETFKGTLLETCSIAMARKVLGQVRMMFNHAERVGKVSRNVARTVKIKSDKRDRRAKIKIPSKEATGALLRRAMPQEPLPMTFEAAYTAVAHLAGLRASEQRGLPWPNVQLAGDHPCIVVNQRADEKGRIGACKTETGYRTIPIGPSLVAVLRRWKLTCPKPPEGQAALVFPNGAGRVERLANIHFRVWKPLFWKRDEEGQPVLDEKGKHVLALPYHNIHAARHFYASLLIDQGFAPKQVQERMGHSSIAITMDHYGHLFRDKENEQAQARLLERAIDW